MIDDLAPLMTRLPDPALPASFRATVMARIERDIDRQSTAAAEDAALALRQRDLPAWLWTLAGLVVVVCASAYGWFEMGSTPDFTSPRIGQRLVLIPADGSTALAIGLGLLLYMAGLLAPLRSNARR